MIYFYYLQFSFCICRNENVHFKLALMKIGSHLIPQPTSLSSSWPLLSWYLHLEYVLGWQILNLSRLTFIIWIMQFLYWIVSSVAFFFAYHLFTFPEKNKMLKLDMKYLEGCCGCIPLIARNTASWQLELKLSISIFYCSLESILCLLYSYLTTYWFILSIVSLVLTLYIFSVSLVLFTYTFFCLRILFSYWPITSPIIGH